MSDEVVSSFKKFVTIKLKTFTSCLSDTLPIMVSLYSNQVISEEENDDINAEKTASKKALRLWEVLSLKGEKLPLIIQAFDSKNTTCSAVIHNSLREYQSTNPHAVQTVQSLEIQNQGANHAGVIEAEDFMVSEMGAVKIRQVLQNYPELENDWIVVPIRLGLSGRARGELRNLNGNFGNLVYTTLSLWRTEKAAGAQFNTVVAIIEDDLGHRLASDELKRERNTIKDA